MQKQLEKAKQDAGRGGEARDDLSAAAKAKAALERASAARTADEAKAEQAKRERAAVRGGKLASKLAERIARAIGFCGC